MICKKVHLGGAESTRSVRAWAPLRTIDVYGEIYSLKLGEMEAKSVGRATADDTVITDDAYVTPPGGGQ